MLAACKYRRLNLSFKREFVLFKLSKTLAIEMRTRTANVMLMHHDITEDITENIKYNL